MDREKKLISPTQNDNNNDNNDNEKKGNINVPLWRIWNNPQLPQQRHRRPELFFQVPRWKIQKINNDINDDG